MTPLRSFACLLFVCAAGAACLSGCGATARDSGSDSGGDASAADEKLTAVSQANSNTAPIDGTYYDVEDEQNSFTILDGKLFIEHDLMSEWSSLTVTETDDGEFKLKVTIVGGDTVGAAPYELLLEPGEGEQVTVTKGDGTPFLTKTGKYAKELNYDELQDYRQFPE